MAIGNSILQHPWGNGNSKFSPGYDRIGEESENLLTRMFSTKTYVSMKTYANVQIWKYVQAHVDLYQVFMHFKKSKKIDQWHLYLLKYLIPCGVRRLSYSAEKVVKNYWIKWMKNWCPSILSVLSRSGERAQENHLICEIIWDIGKRTGNSPDSNYGF